MVCYRGETSSIFPILKYCFVYLCKEDIGEEGFYTIKAQAIGWWLCNREVWSPRVVWIINVIMFQWLSRLYCMSAWRVETRYNLYSKSHRHTFQHTFQKNNLYSALAHALLHKKYLFKVLPSAKEKGNSYILYTKRQVEYSKKLKWCSITWFELFK